MAKLVIKIIHLEKVLSNSPFVIIYSDEAHCNCARKYLISKKPGYIVRYGYMQHGYRDTVNFKKKSRCDVARYANKFVKRHSHC
jgi:hypothetical protein